MPIYNDETLAKILGRAKKVVNKTQVTFQNRGPGRLNKWLSVIQNKKNPYEQRQSTPPSIEEEYIFADPTFKNYPLSVEELRFHSSWLEREKVYVWQADGMSQRVQNVRDLRTLAKTIPPVDEKAVAEQLNNQFKKVEQFVIIDADKYKLLEMRVESTVQECDKYAAPKLPDNASAKRAIMLNEIPFPDLAKSAAYLLKIASTKNERLMVWAIKEKLPNIMWVLDQPIKIQKIEISNTPGFPQLDCFAEIYQAIRQKDKNIKLDIVTSVLETNDQPSIVGSDFDDNEINDINCWHFRRFPGNQPDTAIIKFPNRPNSKINSIRIVCGPHQLICEQPVQNLELVDYYSANSPMRPYNLLPLSPLPLLHSLDLTLAYPHEKIDLSCYPTLSNCVIKICNVPFPEFVFPATLKTIDIILSPEVDTANLKKFLSDPSNARRVRKLQTSTVLDTSLCENLEELAVPGECFIQKIERPFPHLKSLLSTSVKYSGVRHFDTDLKTKMPNLTEIVLKFLTFQSQLALASVKKASIAYCDFSKVFIINGPSLEDLIFFTAKEYDINFKVEINAPKLEVLKLNTSTHIACVSPRLRTLTLEAIPAVLDISHPSHLENLIIKNDSLEKINLSIFSGLRRLVLFNCSGIDKIDFSNFPLLEEIQIDSNVTIPIDLSHNPHLKITYFRDQQKVTLPVSFPVNSLQGFLEVKEPAQDIPTPSLPQLVSIPAAPTTVALYSAGMGKTKSTVRTTESKEYVASGRIKVVLTRAGKDIPYEEHRAYFHDQIAYNEKENHVEFLPAQLTLTPAEIPVLALKDADLPNLKQLTMMNTGTDLTLGVITGSLVPSEPFPLVCDCPLTYDAKGTPSITVYANPKEAVTIWWEPNKLAYYAKANTHTPVKIAYTYQQNPAYKTRPNASLKTCAPLPAALREKIFQELKNHQPLHFLFAKDIPTQKKLELLEAYCKRTLINADYLNGKTSLDRLMLALKTPTGNVDVSCEIHSQLFMLLAQFMGIYAHMVVNENHVRCEAAFLGEDGKTILYYLTELGGINFTDITPLDARANPIPSLLIPTKNADEKKHTGLFSPALENKQPAAEIKKQYRAIFDSILEKQKISSAQDLLKLRQQEEKRDTAKKSALSPLINLTSNQTPLQVDEQLVHQLTQTGFDVAKNYIYLHSAEDIEEHLGAYQINEFGKRVFKEGPLARLLKNKDAIVVINWTSFNDDDLVTYKSVMDANPTLNTEDATGNLVTVEVKARIIGINTDESNACSAVLSRCKPLELASGFFKEIKSAEESKETPVVINLFGGSNWRDILFGDIYYENGETRIKEGVLLKALKAGKPIVLQNPPDDENFRLLMHRLKVNKQFYLGSDLNKAASGFSLKTETIEREEKNSHITFLTAEKKPHARRPIFIGLHNWHELFEEDVITAENKAHTQPGKLAQYDREKYYFHIIDDIPADDLNRLAYEAAQLSHLRFDFLPFSEASKISAMPPEEKRPHQPILISNDIDLAAEELKGGLDNPLVIPLTPQMQFSDLFYSQDKKDDAFTFTQKPLLTALKNGQQVILTGEMSYELYVQLVPLFYGKPPSIWANGKEMTFPEGAKLFAVMPMTAKTAYPLLKPALRKHYDFEHYRKLLPEDKSHLDAIEQFYHYWKKLPERSGIPTPPQSLQLIKNLIAALKEEKPLHRNNPTKGWLLPGYDKSSEDYAYLNVIAKMLFKPKNNHPRMRLDKLIKIIQKHNIRTPDDIQKHIFQLLNCFSPAQLVIFFQGNIDKHIHFATTKVELKTDTLTVIQNFIKPYMNMSEADYKKLPPEKKQSHVKKRDAQLDTLLNKKDCPFIMIRGNAGVGKTATLEELKKNENYVVFTDAMAWKNDTSDKIKIFPLDEANTKLPGTWDFLKGLSQDKKSFVDVEGNVHPLTDKHKVVFLGNPEHYARRYHHALFQHATESLTFRLPEDEFLEKMLLQPILDKMPEKEKLYPIFLTAFKAAQELNPHFTYSLRDLSNAAKRFAAPANKPFSRQDALAACYQQFSSSIRGVEARDEFKEQLMSRTKISIREPARTRLIAYGPKDNLLYLPPEKKHLIDSVRELIDMYEAEKKLGNPVGYFKQGILIEGESGLGKTTLFEAILQEKGYALNHEDPQKRIHKITAGSKTNAKRDIEKVLKEGGMLLLEELNADPEIEELLTQLNHKGLIFASINPRRALSPALFNRFHTEYAPAFSMKELAALAKHQGAEDPEAFAREYIEAKHRHPRTATMRTFYEALKLIRPRASLKPLSRS